MSQENVELVVGLQPAPDVDVAQLFRDDMLWSATCAVLDPVFKPDFECVVRGLPGDEGQTYAGLDGLRALWLDWLAPWVTYRTEIEEGIDLGDRVLLRLRDFGRREASSQEVKLTAAAVWTVHGGKIARIDFYATRAEALKAVGLAE
jgi:ketosteroid isomerase-like protein